MQVTAFSNSEEEDVDKVDVGAQSCRSFNFITNLHQILFSPLTRRSWTTCWQQLTQITERLQELEDPVVSHIKDIGNRYT